MFIYEGYFNDSEMNNDSIITDIEQSNINDYESTYNWNYKFDIYLKDIKNTDLPDFNAKLSSILYNTAQIIKHSITYRNFTICNCEVVENDDIPNCDYFGITEIDKNGDEVYDDFEFPLDGKDKTYKTKTISGIDIKQHYEFNDDAIYAHIKLHMNLFSNTNSYMRFMNSLYRLCSKYLKVYNNFIDFLMTTADLNGKHSCDLVDIGILCGKRKPYDSDALKYHSISESLDTISSFLKNFNSYKFITDNGYSMPKMISDMNNLKISSKCLGICQSKIIYEHFNNEQLLTKYLYATTSWYNLNKSICTLHNDEILDYINIIKNDNTNAYIFKDTSTYSWYYAFIDKPKTFDTIWGCRYLYIKLNFNPLETI